MTSDPILRMEGVSKRFPGVEALAHVDFHVHEGEAVGLMGANGAGKSTLMNILAGIIEKSSGRIFLKGEPARLRSPISSIDAGIAFVSQELNLLNSMSVAENIFADGMPVRNGLVDYDAAERAARGFMQRLGYDIDPRMTVEKLSTGDRQLIEIARALRRDPNILIFDEPTSSLSKGERERLFDVVRAIKADGVAVIYITHFLEEIFEVCDRVTVLRSGASVFESLIGETSAKEVIHQMMGSVESEERLTPHHRPSGRRRLVVDEITIDGALTEIAFTLHAGEIVGLWGLLGSGRTELLRALAGLEVTDRFTATWHHDQGEAEALSPRTLKRFCGFVTEDRRGEGLLLPESVADNIALPNLGSISLPLGIVDRSRRNEIADRMIEGLKIQVSSRDQRVSNLSGGNQQKVVFARWLPREPDLFLLDEPTRGLDVKAKTEILKLILDLSEKGSTVLIASSELEELMRICDRYLIMARGEIVQELPGDAERTALLEAISAGSAGNAENRADMRAGHA